MTLKAELAMLLRQWLEVHPHEGTCKHIHTYIRAYKHSYIYTYIHTYIHTHIHTYIHIYIHTYLLTNIHAYIHIHTHRYTYKTDLFMKFRCDTLTTCQNLLTPSLFYFPSLSLSPPPPPHTHAPLQKAFVLFSFLSSLVLIHLFSLFYPHLSYPRILSLSLSLSHFLSLSLLHRAFHATHVRDISSRSQTTRHQR